MERGEPMVLIVVVVVASVRVADRETHAYILEVEAYARMVKIDACV